MDVKKIFLLILFNCLLILLLKGQNDTVPSWQELKQRPYPQWFKDAKLGIFIHWGVYSVPSWGGAESYGEWFLRGWMTKQAARLNFVQKYWGENFTYRDFAPLFKAELFDADEWASIFKKAGAKYIVLVSKHHDGYCLWESSYAPNWNSMDVGPHRDILQELKTAVEKQKLRFGIYYSLPEWGHPLHRWFDDPNDSIGNYVEQHLIPQFKEVISKYKPEVLFTDGEWYNSAEQWHARELIAWYYKTVGADAIVNDRWGHGADYGFKTPEYSSGSLLTDRPWAEVRGLGRSFGLNRNEKLSAYMSSKDLIHLFVRCVAGGGGLIINVGPAADGKIPLLQQERIEELGEWLNINQEAIYQSKPYIKNGEEKEVTLQRTDSVVNFNWVRNSPGSPIAEDHFTAEWTGYLKADVTDIYTFSAVSDDGMQLFIDNKIIIDQWEQAVEGSDSEAMREKQQAGNQASMKLEKGKFYYIKIKYRENIQNASIALFWESKTMKKEIIPAKNWFINNSIDAKNGLLAMYKSMKQYIAYTTNQGNLYAIALEYPNQTLALAVAKPADGTKITLLGRNADLKWKYENEQLLIDVSDIQFNELPSYNAWVFKIENYLK